MMLLGLPYARGCSDLGAWAFCCWLGPWSLLWLWSLLWSWSLSWSCRVLAAASASVVSPPGSVSEEQYLYLMVNLVTGRVYSGCMLEDPAAVSFVESCRDTPGDTSVSGAREDAGAVRVAGDVCTAGCMLWSWSGGADGVPASGANNSEFVSPRTRGAGAADISDGSESISCSCVCCTLGPKIKLF